MFLPIITRKEARVIYFMGMAKNAGKTETFNAVIREAQSAGIKLGLTSIGWDGELEDRIFQHAKPRIFAPAGFLCATSETLLDTCSAKVTILHKTRFRSLFGSIIIVQVQAEGEIELSGPLWGSQLKEIIAYLNHAGADLILVDGAIDRSAAASPMLTDSCILSTGAVLHKDINVVISKTKDLITQMSLPGISDPSLLEIAGKVIQHNQSAFLKDNDHLVQFNVPSDKKNISIPEDTRAIIFGGHIPDYIFTYYLQNRFIKKAILIARDPTCIFSTDGMLCQFLAQGGDVKVLYPVKLLAITANPVSPMGWKFPPLQFVETMAKAFPDMPVIDVVAGIKANV